MAGTLSLVTSPCRVDDAEGRDDAFRRVDHDHDHGDAPAELHEAVAVRRVFA